MDKLRSDIERGRRAKEAYASYVEEHIKIMRKRLVNDFCNPQLSDEESLRLKRLAIAVSDLEASILADIENAKIAEAVINRG